MTLFDDALLAQLAQHLGCSREDARDEAAAIEAAILEVRLAKRFPAREVKNAKQRLRLQANHFDVAARNLRKNRKIGDVEIYGQQGGPTLSDLERAAQTLEW